MLNKLRFSLRIQLITIALCLVTTSSVLGLSAYLTDVETYNSTFRTASGTEMGFSITGNEYEAEIVTPGSSVLLMASAKVTKEIPLYIFIRVDMPESFDCSDFNSEDWHPVEEDSDVYYYGTEKAIVSTEGDTSFKCDIMNKITLSEDVKINQSYNLNITGYAIQSDNISSNVSPIGIFNMIETS